MEVTDTQTDSTTAMTSDDGIDYYLKIMEVTRHLWLYGAPFLIIPGVICNTLCIVVLSTASFHGSTTGFLLTALAGIDMACLLAGASHGWLTQLMKKDFRDLHVVACKLHVFVTYVCLQMSSWTLVLVTAERTMSVMKPFHVAIYCTKKRMGITWVVMILTSCVFYIYMLFTLDIIEPPDALAESKSGWCSFPAGRAEFFYDFTYWFDMSFSSMLPLLLIVTGNLCIILRMTVCKQRNLNKSSSNKKQTSLTLMLISISGLYILTTAPVQTLFLTRDIIYPYLTESYVSYGEYNLILNIFSFLHYINNTLNFVFYFISGPRFRKAFVARLCPGLMKTEVKHRRRMGAAPLKERATKSYSVATKSTLVEPEHCNRHI